MMFFMLTTPFIMANNVTLERQISSKNDDAEESINSGEVDIASSDLEMVQEHSKQIVGLRFQNIDIPKDSTIIKAYLQFTTDEINSEPTNLIIKGELTPNASKFTYNTNNISSRETTSSSIAWNNIPSWSIRSQREEAQKSPDIKSIIQEIINQETWKEGNALALIISGSGKRVAKSYNGNSNDAPILYIEYTTTKSNNPCITRVELEDMIRNNEDITDVNTSCITDMSYLFAETYSNPDISSWDVSNVTNMEGMFYDSNFNQDISSWDVSNVTNMKEMFYWAQNFNQDISSWDVSNVTNMTRMFNRAYLFNQDISSWDVSNVTDMTEMFYRAKKFNQDISSWDVSNVTNMQGMFARAESFNPNISSWDVSNVTNMEGMFSGLTLSKDNYTNLLLEWSSLTLQKNVLFDAGFSTYNIEAEESRQKMIDDFNWDIRDKGCDTTNDPNKKLEIINIFEYADDDDSFGYEEHFIYVFHPITGKRIEAEHIKMHVVNGTYAFSKTPLYKSDSYYVVVGRAGDEEADRYLYFGKFDEFPVKHTSIKLTIIDYGLKITNTKETNNGLYIETKGRFFREEGEQKRCLYFNGEEVVSQIMVDLDGNRYNTICGKNGEFNPSSNIEIKTYKISRKVLSKSDDAEESIDSGEVDIASSDLEMTQEHTKQIVGLRFQKINIPKGSTITKAYLQFTTDERDGQPTTLTIKGELTPNAHKFTSHINNISSRETTSSTKLWMNIPSWSILLQRGEAQKSPDIKSIIQEIINQDNWKKGNALALIISGDGKRVAKSFDGSKSKAPTLYIEYQY